MASAASRVSVKSWENDEPNSDEVRSFLGQKRELSPELEEAVERVALLTIGPSSGDDSEGKLPWYRMPMFSVIPDESFPLIGQKRHDDDTEEGPQMKRHEAAFQVEERLAGQKRHGEAAEQGPEYKRHEAMLAGFFDSLSINASATLPSSLSETPTRFEDEKTE